MKKIIILCSLMVSCCFSAYSQEQIKSSQFGGQFIPSVVSLNVSDVNGQIWNGTGFFVSFSSNGRNYEFIVTAKHVITGKYFYGQKMKVFINRNLNEKAQKYGDSNVFAYEIPLSTFSISQNIGFASDPTVDIAVVLLTDTAETKEETIARADKYASGSNSESALPEVWRANANLSLPSTLATDIVPYEIREVYFAGYPFGVNLKKWMYPILRSCVVASPDSEGYSSHNFGPYAFLIDCAPIPGDSGSPVFTREFVYSNTSGQLTEVQFGLLGVISQEVILEDMTRSSTRYSDEAKVIRTKLPLGVVYPAHFIIDAMNNMVR